MNFRLLQQLQFDFVSIAAAVVLMLVVVGCALLTRKVMRSRSARRRAARALRGERRAASLLSRHGYRVRDAQLSTVYRPSLGGASFPVALRADYLVTRDGRRYVAEVKTGARAPSLDYAPTRRQLLEYSVAFDVDGVLLVDIEAGQTHEVVFPQGPVSHGGRTATVVLAAVTFALGLSLGALLVREAALGCGSSRGEARRGHALCRALWSRDGR